MNSHLRSYRVPTTVLTLWLALSVPVSAVELTVSTPVAGTVFNSVAEFDCNGAIQDPGGTAYIYLTSYDLDDMTVVKAVNAVWDTNRGAGPWAPGTLEAPNGSPNETLDFKMTAQAMTNDDMDMEGEVTVEVELKVKGPDME